MLWSLFREFAQDMKPIWKSKTFWLNVVGLLIMALSDTTVLQALHISATYAGEALAFLNIANRFLTTTSVSLT